MSTNPFCYKDRKIARLSEFALSPTDLGVLRGYAIFDYLRTDGGVPTLLKEHIQRFQRSAKHVGLTIPVSAKELVRISYALIKKNKFPETAIKFVLTGGPSEDGMTLMSKPTFYVLASEVSYPSESVYTHGVALETHESKRLLPEAKTTNYLYALQHQKSLKKKGVKELLFVHQGVVHECSSSNIFVVKKGVLITPKEGVLAGVTRAQIRKIVRPRYKIVEREVRVSELFSADEVFLTASNKSVMPVVKIDGRRIGNGKVGPVAKDIRARYEKSIRTK